MFRAGAAGQGRAGCSEWRERLDTRLIVVALMRRGMKRYLLVHVRAFDTTAEQGRLRGPLPAARPQRVGSAAAALEGAGRVQLRPRGPGEPGGAAAPGRV